jgi:hypothetical protein
MSTLLVFNNYLCTYDLYGPVRNVFDAGRYIMWAPGPYKSLVHRWFYEHENPLKKLDCGAQMGRGGGRW